MIKNFNFPLVPGKKWSFRYSRPEYGFLESHMAIQAVEPTGDAEVQVIGPPAEPVETPAGKFAVMEIRRNTFFALGWAEADPAIEIVYYYSPHTKRVVKLTAKISKDYPDVTIPDHIEMELIKYGHQVPANMSKTTTDVTIPDRIEMEIITLSHQGSEVKAPVYNDGDWWVFQVKEEGKRPWNARVTYKDGKFDSDELAFLRGEDIPDAPSFLPFASVFLNDPQKKWLDFPLVPGKRWSFRYLYEWAPAGSTYTKFAIAEAEVMGTVAQQMKTPAGSFNLIKIRRTDWLKRGRRADLTYFYSPETKSVVKLTADVSGRSGRDLPELHFEMKLIKFGRGATISEQPVVKAPVIK